jgi:hypothetical protein
VRRSRLAAGIFIEAAGEVEEPLHEPLENAEDAVDVFLARQLDPRAGGAFARSSSASRCSSAAFSSASRLISSCSAAWASATGSQRHCSSRDRQWETAPVSVSSRMKPPSTSLRT